MKLVVEGKKDKKVQCRWCAKVMPWPEVEVQTGFDHYYECKECYYGR